LIVFVAVAPADVEPASENGDLRQKALHLWTTILYYVSIACSIVKFLPQLIRNRKYKIFIGVDLAYIGLQWLGAACLLAAIFFFQDNFETSFVDSISQKVDTFVKACGILVLSGSLIGQYNLYYQDPDVLGRRIGHEQAYYEYMKTRFLLAMASGRGFMAEDEIDMDVIQRHFERISRMEQNYFDSSAPNSGGYDEIEMPEEGVEGDEEGEVEEEEDWECSVCTTLNNGLAPVCASCHSQRMQAPRTSDPDVQTQTQTQNLEYLRSPVRGSVNTAIINRHDLYVQPQQDDEEDQVSTPNPDRPTQSSWRLFG